MPLYESACVANDCVRRGRVFEWLAPTFESKDPPCSVCGSATERQFSRFAMPFSGAIGSRYLDRGLEGGQAKDGGHWAWKKNTISGKPEPVYIETFQQQRDYCRSEGLVMPGDTSPGFISSDGKTLKPASESEAREFIQDTNYETARAAAAAATETQ